MPETRVISTVEDGEGNIIEEVTAEISDEQLQAEIDDARLKEICSMGHSSIKVPVLVEGFVLLCKKLGFSE